MAGLTTLEASAPLEEVIAHIERDGGVIIRDYFDGETLNETRVEIDAALESAAWGQDDFSGQRTKRLYGVFKHTKHAATAARHPIYNGVAAHYLERARPICVGEDRVEIVPNYQIGVTSIIDIHPGEGAQPLHRDDTVWQWRHHEGYNQARVQLMVAITDFTAENGGTMVVPGSHRWDDTRAPKIEEALPTEMAAGSALIWVGGTYHGGGTNNSDGNRIGLTLGFDLGFLRQEENAFLTYPPEIARTFDEDIQKLLGYSTCPPGTGFVGHEGTMADPIFLLKEDATSFTNSYAQFDAE
jgi:ectoine hydroxylase-related dioxygenase (phytanoyl-CoA dioxygenase family)